MIEVTEKMKILCIDDEQSGLIVRKMLLESQGYTVMTATNGREGLEILASSPIDVVVLDYKMPGMDGAEVAAAIKQKWPSLPIVMLSGYPHDIPDEVLSLVSSFVMKGGSPDQLLLVLKDAMKGVPAGCVTILNVDDNEQNRYALTRMLRKAGFNVVEAASGREALGAALAQPNLIVLDINLPDMIGYDVCKRLRADPVTKDIPVIHISATYPADVAEGAAMESGADLFLEHPEDLVEVIEAVRMQLRKHHERRM